MRALVTGAAGFAGQWLCRELLRRGWEITGTMLGDVVATSVLPLDERRRIRWIAADVRSSEELATAVDASGADAVFHLAGIAYAPAARRDPAAALDVNVVGTARLLHVLRERRRAGTLDPVVLIVGSGEQYGRHPEDAMPLAETAGQKPATVYGATKAAQEMIALEAFRSDGLRVVAARSFNHSGPGQGPDFLLPALVRRSLALRGAWERELAIGNTDPVRDFLHVADVARAYTLMAERATPGEAYNVSRGEGVSVGELAARVLALTGVGARLRSDPELLRPLEVPVLVGDPRKLRATTGWEPELSLDQIIDDLIRATSH
ncbi:MAG: GDP-mannose 4,6-dehydratase [Gemmatimonadaceae bacterium]